MNPNENDNQNPDQTVQDDAQAPAVTEAEVISQDQGEYAYSRAAVVDQTEGAVITSTVGDLSSTVIGDASATAKLDARLETVITPLYIGENAINNRVTMPVTRGRVVYYTPGTDDPELYGKKALTAHIADVYDGQEPTRVNLMVLNTDGRPFQRTAVEFLHAGDPEPDTSFATWMPYQLAQAGLR